ncbi:response regulator transcription factor [uncultured Thiocystis sp.]|jgi:DNA-binding response OmpR family regulator|uniref:response regulator transcription factor n=1 Tax=uncultured Thiocystis sp. TaxID=1202134 RepID=UPI0025EB5B0B|nr:response regulator transcription factor [uncultured Thiocystis sp.]
MAQIALLEDEIALREELALFLARRGHGIFQAGSLMEFWPLMAVIDLAILDIMLPDGSGTEAAIRLHRDHPQVGIIMLTARSAAEDKLAGLYGGADHYLVKPVRFLELAGFLDALLRRLVGAGWRLDLARHRLTDPAGQSLDLNAHELVLFKQLSANPGQILSRRVLVEAFGENWLDYDERRLNTMISRLRGRWHEVSGQTLPLKTERGAGFSFGATIQRL